MISTNFEPAFSNFSGSGLALLDYFSYHSKGKDAWGHTMTVLLGKLSETTQIPEEAMDCAKVLDKHYIPTRYPNGFDEGAPTDFYTKKEAEEAIRYGEKIIELCKNCIYRSE